MKSQLEESLKECRAEADEAHIAHGLVLLQGGPAHEEQRAREIAAERDRRVQDTEDQLKALARYEATRKAEERRHAEMRQQAAAERKSQLAELAKPCKEYETPDSTYAWAKRRFEDDAQQLHRADAKAVMRKRADELIALANATGRGGTFNDLKAFFRRFGGLPELHNIAPYDRAKLLP